MVKTSAVLPEMMKHTGPARVFNSEEEAYSAILAGKIKAGDVVVIRYEGPKGGPGMREMLSPTSAIIGMGLGGSVALLTDGRFSGELKEHALGISHLRQLKVGLLPLLKREILLRLIYLKEGLSLRFQRKSSLKGKSSGNLPRKIKRGLEKYYSLVKSASTGAILE